MAQKKSQSLLSSYRKKSRKNSSKALLRVLVAILIIAGLVMLALWATGNLGGGGLQLFATDTPTPTMTLTPTPVTPTNTATVTPTITETPTPSLTPTLDGPFDYVVQEDDYYCATIAEKFDADLEVLLMINNFTSGTCYIKPGDIIKVPAPWQRMPTSTAVPTELRPGTVVDYIVESGATLDSIAQWFRSTPERIIAETNRYRTANGITPLLSDTTPLFIGELLKVPVNSATPVPSATATRTMTPSPTP